MLLHACLFLKVFRIIIFAIIPSETKVIEILAFILYGALITYEQIDNAFAIAVKTVIDNKLFLVIRAREGITFTKGIIFHTHACLATFTITFK